MIPEIGLAALWLAAALAAVKIARLSPLSTLSQLAR